MERESIRLLLVEDNPGDACLFQEAIDEASNVEFSTVHVERLEAGIRVLEDEGFDVILLDLLLPDGMGYDTFVQTHSQAPDIPIIVLTGTNDDALALRCVRGGAQDYLVKGEISSQLLIRTIRHAIERYRLLLEVEKMARLLASRSRALSRTLERVDGTTMDRSRISLDTCVNRALEDLSQLRAETRARITRHALPEVYADPTLVTEVYDHLIRNAAKFVRDKTPSIDLTAEQRDGHWVLGVKDNGIGISKRFRDRVFLPFQRINGRHAYAGTGIGLAICRKIVERHGGSIWVESEPGKGSHFQFTLDAATPEERAEAPSAASDPVELTESSDAS